MAPNKHVKYCVVNTFTETAFKGNPAAVCLLEEERDDEWLQAVAREFNAPIICYLIRIIPDDDPTNSNGLIKITNPRFRIRWFSIATEVKLCGHGTLAASHFLFQSGMVNSDTIEYLSQSGSLIAKRVPDTKNTDSLHLQNGEAQDGFFIELDFPVIPLIEFSDVEVSEISKILNGVSVVDIKKTTTENDIIVVLPSSKAVAELQPQFDEIQKCPGRGILITALAPPGSGFDFVSRVFAPKMGVNEDQVCGSLHCALAPYWSKKLGKCDFVAYQASARGGILNIHLDEKNQRVYLRGKAIAVMEGSLLV